MDEFYQDEVDMYLVRDENSRDDIRKPSFSLQKSHDNLHTYKTKINSEENKASVVGSGKGKYIEKLKKFTQNQDSIARSEIEEGSLHELSKRQRNRISAKQSRDRKKLYIELMEYGEKKLEKQLQEVNREIEDTKNKISQFCSQNKTNVGFATKSQLAGKMERILNGTQTASTNDEINILLDCMSFRIGGGGRDRVNKQNQFYKQIINLSLLPVHRYLMWAATENKHLFNPSPESNQMEEFVCPQYLKFDENQQKKVEQVKPEIMKMKQKLIELIDKLQETKGTVERVLKQIEEEFCRLRDLMCPVQTAKFILFASRNKYRNFFEEQSLCKEEQQLQLISKPSKRVKKQQEF